MVLSLIFQSHLISFSVFVLSSYCFRLTLVSFNLFSSLSVLALNFFLFLSPCLCPSCLLYKVENHLWWDNYWMTTSDEQFTIIFKCSVSAHVANGFTCTFSSPTMFRLTGVAYWKTISWLWQYRSVINMSLFFWFCLMLGEFLGGEGDSSCSNSEDQGRSVEPLYQNSKGKNTPYSTCVLLKWLY